MNHILEDSTECEAHAGQSLHTDTIGGPLIKVTSRTSRYLPGPTHFPLQPAVSLRVDMNKATLNF